MLPNIQVNIKGKLDQEYLYVISLFYFRYGLQLYTHKEFHNEDSDSDSDNWCVTRAFQAFKKQIMAKTDWTTTPQKIVEARAGDNPPDTFEYILHYHQRQLVLKNYDTTPPYDTLIKMKSVQGKMPECLYGDYEVIEDNPDDYYSGSHSQGILAENDPIGALPSSGENDELMSYYTQPDEKKEESLLDAPKKRRSMRKCSSEGKLEAKRLFATPKSGKKQQQKKKKKNQDPLPLAKLRTLSAIPMAKMAQIKALKTGFYLESEECHILFLEKK